MNDILDNELVKIYFGPSNSLGSIEERVLSGADYRKVPKAICLAFLEARARSSIG